MAGSEYQQTFQMTTSDPNEIQTFIQANSSSEPIKEEQYQTSYVQADNGDGDGVGFAVVADGSYLRDIGGNVVGTLNDDGTYSLISDFTPQQLSEGQDVLLENFENQVVDNVAPMPANVSTPVQTKAKSLIKPSVSELISSNSIVKEEIRSPAEVLVKQNETIIKQEIARQEVPSSSANEMFNAVPTETVDQPVQKIEIKGSDQSEPITITTPVVKREARNTDESKGKPAPLGSSSNPIRIIQQGNSYTSTQELTQEQLAQIMQVVQQQQALKEAQEAGGQKVIYNPQTQTKIVYKVVNPTGSGSSANRSAGLLSSKYPKKRGRPKNNPTDDDEDKIDGPELSSKEKEEKKKKRPKTRSGRVSKPPKHMIEDYKHIHLVDWKEDYDDSDGGYSDYKGETDEEERESKRIKLEEEMKKLEDLKPSYKCEACDKVYNSKKRLETHYEMNHGQGFDFDGKSDTKQGILENGATPKGVGGAQQQRKTPWNKNSKRFKLKELMSRCPDEVLLDVMLPKLCSMVTVWEFLLMKIEDQHPDMDVTFPLIYRQFENLRLKVKQAFDENLKEKLLEKVEKPEDRDADPKYARFNLINIRRQDSAYALGAELGTYRVVDKGPNKPDYMFLTTKVTPQSQANHSSSTRKVALVNEQQLRQAKPLAVRPENKIEVVSVPKDRLESVTPKAFKSLSDIKKELDTKMEHITDSSQKRDNTTKPIEIKRLDRSDYTPSKVRVIPIGEAARAAAANMRNGQQVKTEFKSEPFGAATSVSQSQEASLKPSSLPVPSKGSVVLTSTSDLQHGAEQHIANALSTSVVNRTASHATGVVSDMSDLDVWESPKSSVAVSKASTAQQPKMVSIVGMRPEDKTVQLNMSGLTQATKTEPSSFDNSISVSSSIPQQSQADMHIGQPVTMATSEALMGTQPVTMATSEALLGTQVTADSSMLESLDAQQAGAQTLQEIPEGVQMVIQHPDGSYQVIESPEEAARLMQEAELQEQAAALAQQQQLQDEQPTAELQEQLQDEQPTTEAMEQAPGQVLEQQQYASEGNQEVLQTDQLVGELEQGAMEMGQQAGEVNQQQGDEISQHSDDVSGQQAVQMNQPSKMEEQSMDMNVDEQTAPPPGESTSVADQLIDSAIQNNEARAPVQNEESTEQMQAQAAEGEAPSVETMEVDNQLTENQQQTQDLAQEGETPVQTDDALAQEGEATPSGETEQSLDSLSQQSGEQGGDEMTHVTEQAEVEPSQQQSEQTAEGEEIQAPAEPATQLEDAEQSQAEQQQIEAVSGTESGEILASEATITEQEASEELGDEQPAEGAAQVMPSEAGDTVNAESESAQSTATGEGVASEQEQLLDPTTGETQEEEAPLIDPSTGVTQEQEQLLDQTSGDTQEQANLINPSTGIAHGEEQLLDPSTSETQEQDQLIDPTDGETQEQDQLIDPTTGVTQEQGQLIDPTTGVTQEQLMDQGITQEQADAMAQGGVIQQEAETAAVLQEEAQAVTQEEATSYVETSQIATQPATAIATQSSDPSNQAGAQPIDPNNQTLIFQTDDGLILIRQPDGNFQVQSTTGAPINMDTVRALINQLQLM